MKNIRYINHGHRNPQNNGYSVQKRAPKANSRRETLNSAGIDSDQYLSMRIDKEFIPDGAEVVIQVKDKETGELRTVPFSQAMDICWLEASLQLWQEQPVLQAGDVGRPHLQSLHSPPLAPGTVPPQHPRGRL